MTLILNLCVLVGLGCSLFWFVLVSLGFGWSQLVLAGLGWSLYMLVLVGLDCCWSWLVLVFVVFFPPKSSSFCVLSVFVFLQFLCFVSFCVLSVFVFCQFLCFVSFCDL